MDFKVADRDNLTQSPEQDELTVRAHKNDEPPRENETYRDTDYAIGGCNKFGLADSDRYANLPPQYDMTFDERDRYPVYLRQTDDQCIQQQLRGAGINNL